MRAFLLLCIPVALAAQTSPFPAALDTDATLGVPADKVQSALTVPMTTTSTTATVANAAPIPVWSLITFGSELVQVCQKSGNVLTLGTTTACPSLAGRGLSGTTIAAHKTGVIGYLNTNSWYHVAQSSAIEAIETAMPRLFSDAVYKTAGKTLYQACGDAAAQGWTLALTASWTNVATGTCAATIEVFQGGIIQPANGATVTLAGAVTAPAIKIFDYSAGGDFILSGPMEPVAQWFGIKGDGATDNTTFVSAAMKTTMASSKPLRFPASAQAYLVCKASVSGTGPVTIYGDGMYATTFHPFGGPSGCNPTYINGSSTSHSGMFQIITTGAVTLHDFGTDGQRSGQQDFSGHNIYITGPGAFMNETPPASVDLYHLYTANAKNVGIQCSPCQHVKYTDSTSYQNYFFGVSFSSFTPTASPAYYSGFNISGITSINEPLGLGLNFFLKDISISNMTFINAGMGLFQMPNANATMSNMTFDGSPTQGCFFDNNPTCGNQSVSLAALNLEGVSNWNVTSTRISNLTNDAFGFYCFGSTLQIPIPGGTLLQVPCQRGHVDGISVSNSPTVGQPFLIVSTYNGPSPLRGVDITVTDTHLENVNLCQQVWFADGGVISHNDCSNAKNGGFGLIGSTGFTVQSNSCHNCMTAGPGYAGLLINNAGGTTTRDIDVFDNVFANDNGHTLTYGIQDDTGIAGGGSQIRSGRNTCTGCTVLYSPPPAIPTAGTWAVGARIGNNPAVNAPSGWINTTAGAPGKWATDGYNRAPMCVQATPPTISCGDASYGYFTVAAGTFASDVFTTAVGVTAAGAGAAISVQQVKNLGPGINGPAVTLGVPACAVNDTGPVVFIGAGNVFHVAVGTPPTTDPGCYMFSIANPGGR
jgi:hypothetical protein